MRLRTITEHDLAKISMGQINAEIDEIDDRIAAMGPGAAHTAEGKQLLHRRAALHKMAQPAPKPNQIDPKSRTFQHALAQINANSIIDAGYFQNHIPFMYVPGTSRVLYVGKDGEHHSHLRGRVPGKADSDLLQSAYINTEPGAIGRIGINLLKIPRPDNIWEDMEYELPGLQYVAFYISSSEPLISNCIRALVEQGYLKSDAMVRGEDDKIKPASVFAARGKSDQSRDVQVSGQNTWQRQSERAGVIRPGQKWWAPTSEGKL